MGEKIAITGIGLVSPIGIGIQEFYRSLEEGKAGLKEVSGFKVEGEEKFYGGEISNFDAAAYLGSKGLRHLTRGTKFLLAASKLIRLDGFLKEREQSAVPAQRDGVVIGTTLGIFDAISEFYKESIHSGWRGVNPMEFPNCVINCLAGQLAIKEKAQGPNLTIATGHASALDAFGVAMHYLSIGQARTIFVGGVAELGQCIYLMFKKAGLLCGNSQAFSPLGPDCSGTLLGEGAVLFVAEKEEMAKKKGKNILAYLEGYGTAFDARSGQYEYDAESRAAAAAIRSAIKDAGIEPKDIDLVSSGLSGNPAGDAMEIRAIREVCGENTPVIAIKALTGETYDASGAFQVAAALYALEKKVLPQGCVLTPCSRSEPFQPKYALITSFGFNGHNSALVLRRNSV